MKFYVFIMVLSLSGMLLARFYLAADIRRYFGSSLIVALAIINFAALVIGNPALFFGLCFVCFFIGVRTPLDASCRLLLLTAMVPDVSMRLAPGGMYIMELQPTKIFAVALAIVCLAHGRWWRRSATRLSSEDAAIAVLALILTFGAAREASATSLSRQAVSLFFILLPLFMLRRHAGRQEDLRALMGVLVGAGAILAVIAIYEAIDGWSLFDPFWQRLDESVKMSRNLRVRSGLLRSPATFAESTSFAVFQLAALGIALFARSSFRSAPRWLACCGQLGLGLLVAQSRGALLGLFVAIAAAFLFQRSYAKAVGMVAAAGAGVAALLVLAQTNARVASFMQADAALVGEDYRQRLLRRGLEEGMRHLWLGSDIADVRMALADMVQGEQIVDFVNSYLGIFLTGGILGLGTFVILVLASYAKLWRRQRPRADKTGRAQHVAVVAMLSGVLTALAFTSLYERNPFWLLLALTFARAVLYPRREHDRRVAAPGAPAPAS